MLFALNLQWSELNRVLVSKYKQKTVLLLWAMSCNSIFELNTCSLAAGDVGQSNIIGSFVETHHFFSAAFCLCLSVSSWTTSKSYWPVANHFCCSNSMLEAETVKCSALNLKCHWHHTVHFFFFFTFPCIEEFLASQSVHQPWPHAEDKLIVPLQAELQCHISLTLTFSSMTSVDD